MSIVKKFLVIDSWPIEVLLAYESVSFGIRLLTTGDTFASSSVFVVMSAIAPSYIWGVCVLSLGMLRVVAIARNNIFLRKIASIVSMIIWLSIDLSFFFSNSYSTAPNTYFVFVLASAWAVIVLFRNNK